MSDNILESYFVKVSAIPDASSFLKLQSVLHHTDLSIKGLTTSSLKAMTTFEIASVGAFTAIGAGLVSLADKTAMTDQSYRLMGLRFLMTKSSARSMQMALDELGATMDEVAYDPELNERFQFLYEYNQKLGKLLGKNFDANMRSIRDLRMEYKMFGTEFEFLLYGVVSKLFDKLGFSSGDVLNKLQNLNDWFTDNLPGMADTVSEKLVPAWNDAKVVIKDTGSMLKQFAGDFSFAVGVISGDDSIKTTKFDVKNLGQAFADLFDDIAGATLNIQLFGKISGHILTGLIAGVKGYWEALHGNYKESSNDLGIFSSESQQAGSDVKDWFKMRFGDSPEEWMKNPDMTGFKDLATSISGRDNQVSAYSLPDLLNKYGKEYNLNPELLAAIVHQESSGVPGVISDKGAQGLMQLMPKTAKQYGVTNAFDPEQNIRGGAHYFSDLLKKYHGNLKMALAAYNAGPGNVDKYGGVPPFQETQDYVNRVIKEFSHLYQASQEAGGKVVIDTVNIHVPHDLPDKDWKSFVHESMTDILSTGNRKIMAQTAGGAYF